MSAGAKSSTTNLNSTKFVPYVLHWGSTNNLRRQFWSRWRLNSGEVLRPLANFYRQKGLDLPPLRQALHALGAPQLAHLPPTVPRTGYKPSECDGKTVGARTGGRPTRRQGGICSAGEIKISGGQIGRHSTVLHAVLSGHAVPLPGGCRLSSATVSEQSLLSIQWCR